MALRKGHPLDNNEYVPQEHVPQEHVENEDVPQEDVPQEFVQNEDVPQEYVPQFTADNHERLDLADPELQNLQFLLTTSTLVSHCYACSAIKSSFLCCEPVDFQIPSDHFTFIYIYIHIDTNIYIYI